MKKRFFYYLMLSTAISVLPVSGSYAQTATVSFEKADVNGDNQVDISDVVSVINFMAYGGNNEDPDGKKDSAVEAGLCPDTHHPHVIDMGSAGKWACCNVGANAPWEYGGYYAWGETEEKEDYSWETYAYFDNDAYQNGTNWNDCFKSLGIEIAGTDYDVAHVKWGGKWHMPSVDQINLLVNNCFEWTELNDVKGRKYIASNGNSIFLPAAGGVPVGGVGVGLSGYHGRYWSSTHDSNYLPSYAWNLSFNDSKTEIQGRNYHFREYGCTVRPVTE